MWVLARPPRWRTDERAFKPFGLADAPSLTVGFRPVAGPPFAGPCTAPTPLTRPPIPAIRISTRRQSARPGREAGRDHPDRYRDAARLVDDPASGDGRHYVIERELTTNAELDAIVADYLEQAQMWDVIPAAGPCPLLAEREEAER